MARDNDPLVWTKWRPAGEAEEREDLRNTGIDFRSPAEHIFAVLVVNHRPDTIHNVTLVALVEGIALNLTWHATDVRDPPQTHYSFWNSIQPDDGAYNTADFVVPPNRGGPYTLNFLVTFETAEGEQYYSLTTYHGEVRPVTEAGVLTVTGATQPALAMGAGGFLMGASLALGAAYLWVRRQRGEAS